jgi:hypothetical protein
MNKEKVIPNDNNLKPNKFSENKTLEPYEEDVTLYGEMIPSLDNWMTPDNQRQRIRTLEEEIDKATPKN